MYILEKGSDQGMRRFFSFIILFLLFLRIDSYAVTGNSGFEVIATHFNARTYALNGSSTSVVDDVNACLTVPSRLSAIKGLEICGSGNMFFSDTFAGSLSVAYPMPFGTFGFTVALLNYGEVEFRNDDTSQPDNLFKPQESLYGVSFGSAFFGLFAYGINVKYFSQVLTEDHYFSGFAVDLSTHYKDLIWKGFTSVLSVNNIGSSGKDGGLLPMSIVFGFNKLIEFSVPRFGISDLRPSADFRWNVDKSYQAGAGFEAMWYHVGEILDVTGRFSWTWPAEAGFLSGLNGGLGLHFKRYYLDYGVGMPGEMGLVHKLTFTFKWEEPEAARYIRNITDKKIEKTLDEIDRKFDRDEEAK